MEKFSGGDELKKLDEEIDSAVDRLFVEEKKKRMRENLSHLPPASEPSLQLETSFDAISAPPPETGEPLVLDQPVPEKPFFEKPSARPFSLTSSLKIDEDLFEEQPSPPSRVSVPVQTQELSLDVESQDMDLDLFAEKPSPPSRVPTPLPTEEPALEAGVREAEQDLFAELPSRAPSVSPPVSDPLENLETQLLSLEWEITNERIEKSRERVIELRSHWTGQPQIVSVSTRMEKVLDSMLKSDANIRPPMIKFLIDAKDTIRVLSQGEATDETRIARQLAYDGIEARFLALTGLSEARAQKPSREIGVASGRGSEAEMKNVAEIADEIHRLSATMQEVLAKIEERLSRLEQQALSPREETVPRSSSGLTVMVFRLEERVFGVPSKQIFKLFSVPVAFRHKIADQLRIRVKDIDVKLVDLKKLFSIPGNERDREFKILVVKDEVEYKGLMIEQVLQKVSTHSDLGKDEGDYLMGSIPWTYQEHPVEISVLDVKKL